MDFLCFLGSAYISILYYLYYIIKKVPKTRANAVFPDAREQFKAYISRSFFGDDETGE